MRSQLPRLIFSFAVGLFGLGALLLLTNYAALYTDALPLAFFVLLSFIVKRAGVAAGFDTLHSLVGIVDLAAVFIFGPILGAWVPALSSLLYVIISNLEHNRRGPLALFESPLFSAGLKALMSIASGAVYLGLGGDSPPHDLSIYNVIPAAAAMLVWYLLDNIGWGIWEWTRLGWSKFYKLFRETLRYSIYVELLPLPFSMVIAVVYTEFGGLTRPIFILMAAALILVAFVIQRYSESQDRLQRRSRELMALNEFNQAVARAGFDSNQVVELLIVYARQIARADLYRVELFAAGRETVSVRAESRGEAIEWQRDEQAASPAASFVRLNPATVRLNDIPADVAPFELQRAMDSKPVRAVLCTPMRSGEMVLGVLTVISTLPHVFTALTEQNLNALASQAAVAFDNAQLYAVERRRATQLAIVSEVGRRVAQFLDLDLLLQQVVNEIRDRFGYANAHILTEDENGEFVFHASTHPLGEQWRDRRVRFRPQEGIIGWVGAQGEPLLAPDVTREPRYLPGPDHALLNTRSELAVPLVVGHRVLGVLDVQSEQVGAFGEEDLYILNTLAAQLAIAIEDARLYASQKEEAWYLNVLLQVAENLAATTDLNEALETVVRITPLLVGVARCAVLMYDPETQTFGAAKAYGLTPPLQDRFHQLKFRLDGGAPNALDEVWKTQAPVMIENVQTSELVDQNLASIFELEAILLVPLITRGEIVGAMVVDQGPRPRRFSDHERQVLMGIANQAAVAIEGARLSEQAELKKRLDYELGLARQIQKSFLPERVPDVPGYELAAAWRSAREVGGDFYDFIPLPEGRVGISLADVSDKGLPASLFMVLTRTLIRAMAIGKPTPREALERANDLIIADARAEMFVSAFYCVLEPATGQLSFANAGHNPPLWYRHGEEMLTTLRLHGMALGVHSKIELPEAHIDFQPGDILLIYTDGVTDALNPQGEDFGARRLADIVLSQGDLSAKALVDEILQSVDNFVGTAPPFDDLTMVVVKRML